MILGIWIKIKKLSAGKRSMYIDVSGWHTFCFGALSSLTVIRWRRWRSRLRWRPSWGRCICAFASPVLLSILCYALLARKAAACLIFTNHCRVSFYRSIYLVMPKKHKTPLLLFWEFGARFVNQLLCFLYCGTRKPSFGHFGFIQCKTNVAVFKLYPTSLSCHGSWHVENLQEISCYF